MTRPAKRPIGVGILGAARIAPSALIAPARGRDDVEVRCIAARDPARAAAFAKKHAVPDVAPDYAALLARDDVDLVYVPLPPSAHAEWTIRALEAGKAVLCEKPFAASAADARAMVEAAERTGQPLMEAFHYRFHAVMRRAEALVAGGALGRIRSAEAIFEGQVPYPDTLWRGDLGSGALTDIGCYPLHALRTLFGEPRVARANLRSTDGTIVFAQAELAFPEGVDGRMRAAMTLPDPKAPPREWWLRVDGDGGRLEISNYIAPHLFGCEFTTFVDGIRTVEPVTGPTTYEAQLAHVVDVLACGATPLTGGADAVNNMVLIDAIRAAGA